MGLFTEKYNSPFDNEQSRKKIDDKITASHIRPARYLTTRASLFLGYTLISLCLEYLISGNVLWWPAACATVCLLIWSVTFRFITVRKLSVLSFAFILTLFIFVCEISYRLGLCAPYAAVGFIPMAVGIMLLARFKDEGDDKGEYTRTRFGSEVLLPFLLALGSALFGTLISYIFEKRYLFVSLLASVMFIVLLSWVVTGITGVPRRATSKKLTEFWDIPTADIAQLRRFVFARGEFTIISIICMASLFILRNVIDPDLFRILAIPVCEAVALCLGIVAIYTAKHNFSSSQFGLRYIISEVSMAGAFISLFFLVNPGIPKIPHVLIALVFVLATDVVVTGLLSVIRRRLIFVSKSVYIDGLPFYLILVSLVVMLAETCLYSIPGL